MTVGAGVTHYAAGEALVVELRQKRKERMTEIFSRFTEEEAKTVLQSLKSWLRR